MKRIVITILIIFCFCASLPASERMTPVVQAVLKVQNAVVNIRTETIVKNKGPFNDPFFDEFMGFSGTYKSQSLGTGVIISSDGYIITNYHVIEASTAIMVILRNDAQLEAKIVGGDPLLDIAILKVDSRGASLPYLPLGTSRDLLPGETVIAIGNPYGLSSSVTTGVVSNTRRILKVSDSFSVFIQTDALINPGNSGGPLINLDGEVIGINSAIYRDAQGIGFAIPIDTVKRVLPDLIKYQKIRRGYLGFELQAAGAGLCVSNVAPNSEAMKMGIQRGDCIITLDAIPVGDIKAVNYILRTFPPGETIRLSYIRNGKDYKAALLLTEYPKNYGLVMLRDRYGVEVAESKGVIIVTSSKYPQYIREGDFILAINGVELRALAQLDTIMSDAAYEELTLSVSRNRRVFEIRMKP